VAVWGYWSQEGKPSGNGSASSLLVSRGDTCFWHFPLDDQARLVSAGIVVRADGRRRLEKDAAGFYRAAIDSCDALSSLLPGAVLRGPVQTADIHAYASRKMSGPGWFLVGDAACFVDALLTPGVQLAVQNGTLAAQALHTILGQPDMQAQCLSFYEHTCRRQYETFVQLSRNLYAAAGTAANGGAQIPPVSRPGPEPDGQFAFLSLIAGLPKTELAARLGSYMALRNKAAAWGGAPVTLGEKEGFTFLSWRFHQGRLAQARDERVTSELDEDSVVLPAPGAAIGDEAFAPADGTEILQRRRAVSNRLGDRFHATPELVTLLDVLGTGCPYGEVRRRFCEAMAIPADTGHATFRDWIGLLADHLLIEWRPASRGVPCAE
jgi:hypothetical protein